MTIDYCGKKFLTLAPGGAGYLIENHIEISNTLTNESQSKLKMQKGFLAKKTFVFWGYPSEDEFFLELVNPSLAEWSKQM